MATAHQSAMAEPVLRRGAPADDLIPHELVAVEHVNPALTLAKIAGLLAISALGTTLVIAIVAGGALFALLNFR
jgi:hypothetical protein